MEAMPPCYAVVLDMKIRMVLGLLVLAGCLFYFFVPKQTAQQPSINNKQSDGDKQLQSTLPAVAVHTVKEAVEVSSLAQYPGFGHNIEQDEDRFTREEMQRETLIAECMKDNGFDYTPTPSVVIDENAGPEEFERLLALAASDPNEGYVASLSANQRKAYYLMLTGMENPNDPEGKAQQMGANTDSCLSRAFAAIPGVYARRNRLIEPFRRMELEIARDPQMRQANQMWSECMDKQGLSYATPSDIHAMADETRAQLIASGAPQSQMEQASLALLDTEQKAHECMLSSGYQTILTQVRIAHENRFVQMHHKELNDE